MVFFLLLDFVAHFLGIGCNPEQSISNIYWRIIPIGVLRKFFLGRIVTHEFSKLAPESKLTFRFFATSLVSSHTGTAEFLQGCRWAYLDW